MRLDISRYDMLCLFKEGDDGLFVSVLLWKFGLFLECKVIVYMIVIGLICRGDI